MWQWLIPLATAAIVFCAVLLLTPPGFGALPVVVLNTARGATAEAASYAVGAAATLALAVLVALSGVWFVIGLLRRQLRPKP